MKVIGVKNSSFKGQDGNIIKGMNIYVTYPPTSGEGEACERIYMTDAKLAQCAYVPKVGDMVDVAYNRYGKPAVIMPVKH